MRQWAAAITKAMFHTFIELYQIIDRLFSVDGSERMTGSLPLQRVVTADLPAASSANEGNLIWVTDASAGNKLKVSDGTSWLSVA
jgi:hypothetical protein